MIYSLWVCMELARRNTDCSCNFAPRPDGVFIFFISVWFFLILYMRKFTGIFVPAVTTCDRFLCCYCETVGAEAGPVQNPAGFHNENIMKSSDQIWIRGVKKIASKHWEPLKRSVVTSSKDVLWIGFERKKMYSGTSLARSWRPKDLRQLRLVWRGADDVLRLQTDVRDEVGESGKSRM